MSAEEGGNRQVVVAGIAPTPFVACMDRPSVEQQKKKTFTRPAFSLPRPYASPAPGPVFLNALTPAGNPPTHLAIEEYAGSSKSAVAEVGPKRGLPGSVFAGTPCHAQLMSVVSTRDMSVEPSLKVSMSLYPAVVRTATAVVPPCTT